MGMFDSTASLEAQLTRVERKLDLILEHLQIRDEPPRFADVEQLVLQDKQIQAIKAYRVHTGAGLKEAKDIVDDIKRRLRP